MSYLATKMNVHRDFNGEWAVSETVGFVIIFGIMMTGIAMVTLFGYPALLNAQADANIRNMERNMIVLQSDVNALVYKSVPYKETTMQVSGGVLSVENPNDDKSLSVKVDGVDILNIPASANRFQFGNLLFKSETGLPIISLLNGAVVKRELSGSVMLSEPRWFFDDATKTFVITLIQVDSSNNLAKSGICTIRMEISPMTIDVTNTIIKDYVGNPKSVYVNYRDPQSDFYRAWDNYLRNTLKMEKDVDGWKMDNVERLIIKAYRVTMIGL